MDPTVNQWRRRRRTELLALRQALDPAHRLDSARIVGLRLDELVAARGHASIGLYWPIKHEINLLSWAAALALRDGAVLCLPVVVTPKAPLEYWRWTPGEPLARGFWDIPIPNRRDPIEPELMLAPMLGFDRANYRLGYGGGYFDRTLASLKQRPMVVGIGYDFGAEETIFPQPHDIPMDAVVTERRDTLPLEGGLHAD